MLRQSGFGVALLALIALDFLMAAVAIMQYPAFFQQRLAQMYLLELAGVLLVYAAGAICIAKASGELWISEARTLLPQLPAVRYSRSGPCCSSSRCGE